MNTQSRDKRDEKTDEEQGQSPEYTINIARVRSHETACFVIPRRKSCTDGVQDQGVDD